MIVYKGRLLQKSSNRTSDPKTTSTSKIVMSTLVTTWLFNIAIHLWPIWLQTLVAINAESRLTLFPSFSAPPSEVAVLFNYNLSRRPFLGQVVDFDLLLCTLHRIRFGTCGFVHGSYVIFLLSDQWMIKRLSEAMSAALVGNNFSPIPFKISFHMKSEWLVTALNLRSIDLFDSWTESVSQEW